MKAPDLLKNIKIVYTLTGENRDSDDIIPGYERIKSDFLKVLGDGRQRSMEELTEVIGLDFRISIQDLGLRYPSKQRKFKRLVRRARSEFRREGIIFLPSPRTVCITQKGLEFLKNKAFNPAIF